MKRHSKNVRVQVIKWMEAIEIVLAGWLCNSKHNLSSRGRKKKDFEWKIWKNFKLAAVDGSMRSFALEHDGSEREK